MRSNIADYDTVVEAAKKFTRSVAEGNSKYAKELFTEDACLFGFLNGKVDPAKLNALIFDQFQSGYYVTGEKVGLAWNAGKPIMQKK